ncbi:TPA: FAD-dependent oxidoreductase [Pseudomonas putida]|uniref:Fumarate reductase/succinate dehydrogenase flavoprotein domain protein n=1 Tax=Pseudomonas putida (strain GB-1) TaxID=76869 RepID=B0KTF7_PSEPG|nr:MULTISPECIES: FAD-dependent oxidoreductase [Pseudomonas]ABY98644.1 fumarate reductase/succinate dehydrogenase flavoprotein domain protein [Pseudomonas putida GB-1]MBP0709621.1 FAD-dependent oxidoreductase [Pseudomonas sp. T34]MCE1001568.1 FAD-dependent oxidoreductase [Pseudomonas sp. NMI1173_11]MCK2189064.1 FAD-dependent oxidoreductase [Pseudomonas sp. MB04B]MDD2086793.1 FAD-dependent oxidoreductase [Pseudomonas putida]
MNTRSCDVLVIGAGAGGLATAITAKKLGLDVIVIEKDDCFGGTTAFSGGVLWVPGNPHGAEDSHAAAMTYLRNEAGACFDAAGVEAFLRYAPQMVAFFERETAVKFVPTLYPDYHPQVEGGVDVGRSILAAPYDIRGLGPDMARLRPPLKTITFIGMMFNSSNADLKHFFNVTRSLTSFVYVAKRLITHLKELALYRRGTQVTSGNALAARLVRSALDLGIPILTGTPARQLLHEEGRVTGALVGQADSEQRIQARRGVVLACGGFSHDLQRLRQAYPHVRRGGEHFSPVPAGNTGDGARMAEALGAKVDIRLQAAAAWMPVSKVPVAGGRHIAFPHLLDRYKPGVIGVLRSGQRFTNESNSYHDVGTALIEACAGQAETAMWLVCDRRTLAKYGLGFAKPAPMPLGPLLRNGYLLKGKTLAELAGKAGIDAQGLQQTVREYNLGAVQGEDRQFGRGSTSFNRYLADPQQQPNPCVAPVGEGPYFAVKVIMGDLGTFDGLRTSVVGEVLAADGQAIDGLYAVGNDRASIMGGNYPGAGITLGPIMTFGYITGRHLAGVEQGLAAAGKAREVA